MIRFKISKFCNLKKKSQIKKIKKFNVAHLSYIWLYIKKYSVTIIMDIIKILLKLNFLN